MRTRSLTLVLALLAGLLILPTAASAQDSSEICDTEGLVEAVESGPEDGTLAGMADDPVGTAASSNPVLTTLVQAVQAAGLVDTINAAESLTVFAPTDCAFAALDEATLNAALADPTGLLTTVLGFHVIAGERIASGDLDGTYETFTGEMLEVTGGDTITLNGGMATVQVPDIETANATVYLIDSVMIPPSVTGAAQDGAASEEPTATEEPAADAATEEPAADAATEEPAADAAATAEPTAEATAAPAADDAGATPTGGVATGAGGTADDGSSLPLVAMGLLALLAGAGAFIWRRSV